MSRILFLDIDGVLNSNFWNNRHQVEISDGTLIDEEKIKLLAYLVRETNSEIILHSGWRFWFDSGLKPLCKEAVLFCVTVPRRTRRVMVSGLPSSLAFYPNVRITFIRTLAIPFMSG